MNTSSLDEASKTLERIGRMVKRFIDRAIAFPQRPCYRMPCPDHVSHIARGFRSPLTHSSALLKLFLEDPDFAKIVPQDEAPLILEIAADLDELRANFYPMDNQCPHEAYEGTWASSGVFRYTIDELGVVTQITRKNSQVRYDKEDVIYSYSRRLTLEERGLLRGLFL